MSGLLSAVFQPLRFIRQGLQAVSVKGLVEPESFCLSTVRTKVRCYFPRPNEVRRVRRHGWETRMSTHNGRKVTMRRLLKGRYVLTH